MVGVLFVGFFRLDEMIGRPKKMSERRPLAGGLDYNGMPICMDPDGKPLGRIQKHHRASKVRRQS